MGKLNRIEIKIEDSPFTVDHMVDLLQLLQKDIINGTSFMDANKVEGGKLLIDTYLPPNETPTYLPSQHPLLPSLTSHRSEHHATGDRRARRRERLLLRVLR